MKRVVIFVCLFVFLFIVTTIPADSYSRGIKVHIPRIMLKHSWHNPASIKFRVRVYDGGRIVMDKSTGKMRCSRMQYAFGPLIEIPAKQDWTPVNMCVKIDVIERGLTYNSVYSSVEHCLAKGTMIGNQSSPKTIDNHYIYMEYIIDARW